ncbi:hypothetical protein HanXRQr2_Chr07g0284841 [Helianthus annuus]|uniref:Uncharacterized protein n=1 Tax=Helianthus annuus TaxID=4232 RepID=A0A9K3IJM4_HELAN|nr:hypothetical protein HanXRQr2_Chr07g0284841 [Helianthus annuus]KAJ0903928.1 hypothetical protein HanPSC8_Chr07g0275751 [Helianthus annuus]
MHRCPVKSSRSTTPKLYMLLLLVKIRISFCIHNLSRRIYWPVLSLTMARP